MYNKSGQFLSVLCAHIVAFNHSNVFVSRSIVSNLQRDEKKNNNNDDVRYIHRNIINIHNIKSKQENYLHRKITSGFCCYLIQSSPENDIIARCYLKIQT